MRVRRSAVVFVAMSTRGWAILRVDIIIAIIIIIILMHALNPAATAAATMTTRRRVSLAARWQQWCPRSSTPGAAQHSRLRGHVLSPFTPLRRRQPAVSGGGTAVAVHLHPLLCLCATQQPEHLFPAASYDNVRRIIIFRSRTLSHLHGDFIRRYRYSYTHAIRGVMFKISSCCFVFVFISKTRGRYFFLFCTYRQ